MATDVDMRFHMMPPLLLLFSLFFCSLYSIIFYPIFLVVPLVLARHATSQGIYYSTFVVSVSLWVHKGFFVVVSYLIKIKLPFSMLPTLCGDVDLFTGVTTGLMCKFPST